VENFNELSRDLDLVESHPELKKVIDKFRSEKRNK